MSAVGLRAGEVTLEPGSRIPALGVYLFPT